MFGYVSPQKSELKMREWTRYHAEYCGLCKTLRHEYGQIERMVLDYDCTFLALLLEGVTGTDMPCQMKRCGYKPFKRKEPVAPTTDALLYAADCNVLLYRSKLKDDWMDEKSISAWTGSMFLSHGAKRAAQKQPMIARCIEEGIAALSYMEKRGEQEIDRVTDAFAGILREIAAGYAGLEDKQRRILRWLGYHMGRWIYLMDAWEDRQKDQKSGSYNPFLAAEANKEQASFLLYAALSEMENAYDLLDIQSHKGILDNILYIGCRQRTKQALEGAAG